MITNYGTFLSCPCHIQQQESHLCPLWFSALPSRMVRESVFSQPSCLDTVSLQPILTSEFCTGSDEYFFGTLAITWDDIRAHPFGSLIAFYEACLEHELEVQAQILGPKDSLMSTLFFVFLGGKGGAIKVMEVRITYLGVCVPPIH